MFIQMLQVIGFLQENQLIIVGDYIDRGQQNAEVLHWILNPPENVLLLCGNHDKEFVTNVELMRIRLLLRNWQNGLLLWTNCHISISLG